MKDRLKVLHFISDAGRSPFFCVIAEHANRTDFEINVATLSPAGDLQKDMEARGLRTFALDCLSRKNYMTAVLRLASLMRREQFDVVQTHLFDANLVGLAAARLARVPLTIFTAHHSHEVPLLRKSTILWADQLASRLLSHNVIAHSVQMKETLVREERVPPEKIAVIPLGFDLNRWHVSMMGRERIRAELGLGTKIVFGTVGRMYWMKNFPALFKAFASLAQKTPDVVLLVIGEGEDESF